MDTKTFLDIGLYVLYSLGYIITVTTFVLGLTVANIFITLLSLFFALYCDFMKTQYIKFVEIK